MVTRYWMPDEYKVYIHKNKLAVTTEKETRIAKEKVKKYEINFFENVAKKVGSINIIMFDNDITLLGKNGKIFIPGGIYNIEKGKFKEDNRACRW